MKHYTVFGGMAYPVQIKVDLLKRLPAMIISGLPAHGVRETAERVRSAIVASGLTFPKERIVIEITSPVPIQGTGLDLGIALEILRASGVALPLEVATSVPWAELSLSGALRPVRGGLAIQQRERSSQMLVARGQPVIDMALKAMDLRNVLSPGQCVWEHGVFEPAVNLFEPLPEELQPYLDQAAEERPVLLRGPIGCGKTMIACRIPPLLPALSGDQAMEVSALHDGAGMMGHPSYARPFRAPHHTVSQAGMFGGSSGAPGEYSLAHRGVLFLDDVEEFPMHILKEIAYLWSQPTHPLYWVGGKIDRPWKPARLVMAMTKTDHPALLARQEKVIEIFKPVIIEM